MKQMKILGNLKSMTMKKIHLLLKMKNFRMMILILKEKRKIIKQLKEMLEIKAKVDLNRKKKTMETKQIKSKINIYYRDNVKIINYQSRYNKNN